MEQDITTCPNCKKEFKKQRSNQKYCSDKCRMQYNNKKYDRKGSRFKEINGLLRKNYRIIMDLLGDRDSETIDYISLLKKGFSFDYLTHHEEVDGKKQSFYGIYDFYYCRLDNDNFKFLRI